GNLSTEPPFSVVVWTDGRLADGTGRYTDVGPSPTVTPTPVPSAVSPYFPDYTTALYNSDNYFNLDIAQVRYFGGSGLPLNRTVAYKGRTPLPTPTSTAEPTPFQNRLIDQISVYDDGDVPLKQFTYDPDALDQGIKRP